MRLVSVLTLLSCVGCRSLGSADGSEVKVINGVEIDEAGLSAVVNVRVGDLGNCTGTFVNDTTLITAAHCIDRNDPTGGVSVQGIDSVNVFIPPLFGQLIDSNNPQFKLYDQAVLVFPDGTGDAVGVTKYVDVASSPIRPNDPVVIAGFGSTSLTSGAGAGVLRVGQNRVLTVEGDAIAFSGTTTHPATPSGQNASSAPGDSGGPMLNAAGQLVGTTGNGGTAGGFPLSVYISTTGPLARQLYRSAIQCTHGRPCAKNFAGSGVIDGDSDIAGQLCGQATQATRVCITPTSC